MKTNVYSNFLFFEENRKLSEGLVKRLIESIQRIGYVPGKPILINKHWQIIDGQHRFEACKRLKLPIYYEFMQNGDDMQSIIELNRNQLIWRLVEYIDFYAKQGRKEFIYLNGLIKEYSILGSSNIIRIVVNNDVRPAGIREGKYFKINPNTLKIINYILGLNELDFYDSVHFVCSIVTMWKYTSDVQRQKLYKYRMIIPQAPNQKTYLTIFENIINKHIQDENKINLTMRK